MSKKRDRVIKSQPEAERAIRALKAAQSKREKRYANTRIVYVYFDPDARKCTDNIIVLPADTVDAHEEYLRRAVSFLLDKEDEVVRKALQKFMIRRIATFDVETYEMRPIRKPIDLFCFGDLFKKVSKK